MDDDNSTTDTTATTETTVTTTASTDPATAPAGKAAPFSPEQQAVVDAIVKQRLERDRAQRPKDPSAKAAPEAKSPNGSISAADVQRLLNRERALTRAATAAGLNDRQLERMGTAMANDNPDDAAAWGAAYLADMGIGKATVTTQPSTTTTTPPAVSTTQPAKVETSTVNGGVIDLWGLSSEQLNAMGPSGIREAFEKVIAHGTRSSGAPPLPKVMTRK